MTTAFGRKEPVRKGAISRSLILRRMLSALEWRFGKARVTAGRPEPRSTSLDGGRLVTGRW